MSSSAQTRIPVLTLLALALPTMEGAKKQQATNPNDTPDTGLSAFLAELLTGKCVDPDCTLCSAAASASGESTVDQASNSASGAPQDASGQQVASPPQEELRASGSISAAACRAVGLTNADTGAAARLKGSAAALITELEDLRDSLIPGAGGERLTAEGHIGAVARACSWAVSLLPKQAA